ncbi:MAG: hypothetical protein PHW07_01605 [Sulfurospirillaceae bacterium]|nr:hypothetical protein [Sulfurospirillaceae bacterium]
MKFVIAFCLFVLTVQSADISPRKIVEASGNVQNIAIYEDMVLAGTNAGTLDIYKLEDGSLVKKIEFGKIKDFTGDEISPKVFSVDKIAGSEKYLAVTQASNGARSLFIVDDGEITEVINQDQNLFISKAKFIDKDRALLALLSNELILFDLKAKKEIYRVQISPSHFTDFMLSKDKKTVATSSESGEVAIVDVSTGKTMKTLSGGNVDNIYKVDFKNGRVLCAGQDRRGIVYNVATGDFDRYDGSFLIYAGAMSPSGKLGVFAFNEKNDMFVFNLDSKSQMHKLIGQRSTLNSIVFANEKDLVSGSDDKFIMIWRLP